MSEIIRAEDPLVSVIIPSYNHAHYLGRALQSVLDQTYTNWEAIVVDNHSTDHTDKVIEGFAHPRIKCLKINNNGVIGASRNLGIRAANGVWVAFLDSDDWWVNDKLLSCVQQINHEYDFVYHDLVIVGSSARGIWKKLIKSWQVKCPVLLDLIENGNAIATSSVLVRFEFLNRINGMNESLDMVAAEDYNAWLRIADLGARFKYIPKALGFYQVHAESMSRKNMAIPIRSAVKEFLHRLNQKNLNQLEAEIKYLDSRFNIGVNPSMCMEKNLLFCMQFGRPSIKLKSMLILGLKLLKR